VILQKHKYDCGLNCIYNISSKNINYDEFCNIHYKSSATSLSELKKIVNSYNGEINFFKLRIDEIRKYKSKFLVLTNKHNAYHLCIFKKISKKFIFMFCPSSGDIKILIEDFSKIYLGIAGIFKKIPSIKICSNIKFQNLISPIFLNFLPLIVIGIDIISTPISITLSFLYLIILSMIKKYQEIHNTIINFILLINLSISFILIIIFTNYIYWNIFLYINIYFIISWIFHLINPKTINFIWLFFLLIIHKIININMETAIIMFTFCNSFTCFLRYNLL